MSLWQVADNFTGNISVIGNESVVVSVEKALDSGDALVGGVDGGEVLDKSIDVFVIASYVLLGFAVVIAKLLYFIRDRHVKDACTERCT